MSTNSIGATRACSLAVTALLTHKLVGSGIAKQAQAYLTAGGSCLRDPINLAGWGRTAQEVERMSDFYRSKKKQSGFGVGTFRILDLSTPTSVIKNICRTWGVQMVLEVLELIQQRLDQVSTDSSLQDKLNALQPAGDVKAGTLLANNAARLKEELHRIDAVAKRMGREQEPKTNVPRHPRLAKNLFRDSVAILEKNGADERIACIICGTSSTRAFILVPRMPHKGAPSLSLKPTPMPSFDKDEVLLTELSGVEWNSRVMPPQVLCAGTWYCALHLAQDEDNIPYGAACILSWLWKHHTDAIVRNRPRRQRKPADWERRLSIGTGVGTGDIALTKLGRDFRASCYENNKLCKTILHDRYVPADRFQIVEDGDFRSFDPSHMNEIVKQLGDVPDSIFSSTGCCKTCSLGNTRSVFQQPEAQNVLESKLNSSGFCTSGSFRPEMCV